MRKTYPTPQGGPTEIAAEMPDCAGRNGAHTPGPWRVGDVYVSDCHRFAYLPVEAMDGTHVADVEISTHYTVDDPLATANARLIASAPDLLAATRLLPTHWLESGVLSDQRADGLRIKLHIEGTDYEHEFTVAELRAASAAIARATGAA